MDSAGFQIVALDESTVSALADRAPQLPLDEFQHAVSRFMSEQKTITPAQVRDDLGGRDAQSTATKLEGLPAIAGKFQNALGDRSFAVSERLTMMEHSYGEAGLIERLENDLERFLDLCEMARRDASRRVKVGARKAKRTELVRDLARSLRLAQTEPDASQAGQLVQAFDIAVSFARKRNPEIKKVKDVESTVRKALKELGKE